jgi:esterase/lipase superfamily enzyme
MAGVVFKPALSTQAKAAMIEELMASAVAELWSELPDLFGAAWPETEARLLVLLRELDASRAERATAQRELAELFHGVPDARQRLVEVLARLRPTVLKGHIDYLAPAARPVRHIVVPVCFATDRAQSGDARSEHWFGPDRGGLSFGRAEVSIPDDHRMGRIEKPRWWRLEFRKNPDKHVVLLGLATSDREAFAAQIRADYAGREALLFVHGYNVTFESAVERTAQITYDLQFAGVPMLFSWPSQAVAAKYTVDETNARWAQPHFREFVQFILDHLDLDVVHVIAHSMGNRVVAESLHDLASSSTTRMRQVMFAAPDIDADTFQTMVAAFEGRAERYTLYASSEDSALKLSKAVHGYARAGESGPGLVVVKGVDTIDATAVDTSLLGHTYYGDNRSILSDMFALLRDGNPPEQRFGLRECTHRAGRYFEFKP